MKYKICHFLEHVDDRVDFCKLLHLGFKKSSADDDDDCLGSLMDHICLGSFQRIAW